MSFDKRNRHIQTQHASPDKVCAIRTRMLQGEWTAKIERGLSFSPPASAQGGRAGNSLRS